MIRPGKVGTQEDLTHDAQCSNPMNSSAWFLVHIIAIGISPLMQSVPCQAYQLLVHINTLTKNMGVEIMQLNKL